MPRIAYVNGRYVPLREAAVAVEDRGFQFGDSVYEVVALARGRFLDAEAHMARLWRSLAAIRLAPPLGRRALAIVLGEVVRRNRLADGIVYLQVSRGRAPRDHAFPGHPTPATLVVTARPVSWAAMASRAGRGIAVVTRPDTRWRRCDIKSTNLLPNVLAKQEAREAGAGEAWFVDEDGFVTEGASSNAWIVNGQGRLLTRPLSAAILPGITRQSLLELASSLGMAFEERAFSVAEAYGAREAFTTGALALVTPVIAIDGHRIGEGTPGALGRALRAAYWRRAER